MLTCHVREDNTGIFYYADLKAGSVSVTGDFISWKTPGIAMQRGENCWYAHVPRFPQGESTYKFIVDGRWIKDPNNVMERDENSLLYNKCDKGMVYHFSFYSPSIGENRGYCIYLPPAYFLSDNKFSTLYMLHGALDWEFTWVQRGDIHWTLNRLRAQGKIGDMIVVMPRENGEFFHGDERFGKYIAQDLIGHIDKEFKTIDSQQHRGIDGLSTGGYSSTVLGSSHSSLFSSVGTMSGSYDQRVFNSISRHKADIIRHRQRYHVSCGQGDPSMKLSRSLSDHIRALGIPCEYYENPGPHDWEFWGPNVSGNLQFHWWNFQRK